MPELDYDQYLSSDADASDDQGPPCDDILHYNIGDLVWAKVKSHPWWPGQVFDPALASEEAKTMAKPDRILVAFFGDHTFSWLECSQIRAFRDCFKVKMKTTTAKRFKSAVLEALDEVCWQAESGLQCKCCNTYLSNEQNSITKHWAHSSPTRFKDVKMSKITFSARRFLSFLKDVARSPCNSFSSIYEATVLHGHTLGLRTGLFSNIGEDALLGSNSEPYMDMSESSLDASDKDTIHDTITTEQSRSEYRKRMNDEFAFPTEDQRAKRHHVVENHNEKLSGNKLKNSSESSGVNIEIVLTSEAEPVGGAGPVLHCESHAHEESGCINQHTKKEVNVLSELSREKTKPELKQTNQLEVTPCNIASFCDGKATHILIQTFEALQFLAIDPLSSYAPGSRMVRAVDAILSYRNFVFQKSTGYNTQMRSSCPQDGERIVAHSVSEHAKAMSGAKAIRFCRPTSKKCRLYASADVKYPNNTQTIDEQMRQNLTTSDLHKQCTTGATHEEGKKISEIEWHKTDALPGLSFMKGAPQAHANSQIDVDSTKLDVHALLLEAQRKKSDLFKRPHIGSLGRESSNQDRRDVYTKAVFGMSMDIKQSHEMMHREVAVNEAFADAPKPFLYERIVSSDEFGDNAGSPCVANPDEIFSPEHLLEVNSGTGLRSVEQGSSMEPSEDTGVYYASDAGACSVESGPTILGHSDDTGVDFTSDTGVCSADQGSTVEPPLFRSENLGISSHQSSEDGRVSHLRVGLYMRFPSSFTLPSEFQLNSIFTQFGALGNAGIRVFRETASAQVIFEHAKEAERAYRCVKEVSPFGDASVVFRLQYFAHL